MNRIEFGDCRATMRRWAEQGVRAQMCVTSPPYFGLRDYGHDGQIGLEETPEQYIAAMVEVFRCVRDVLADDGTLWLNIGDSYAVSWGARGRGAGTNAARPDLEEKHGTDAPGRNGFVESGIKPKDMIGIPWMLAFALRADGWYLRQDIIWHKPNPMPESIKDRCTKSHEYVFLLSKSERYFVNPEGMQEPATGQLPGNRNPVKGVAEDEEKHRTRAGLHAYAERQRSLRNSFARESKDSAGEHGQTAQFRADREPVNYEGTRNRRSVWTIPTRPYSGAHFATFPTDLPERCILMGSRPGDVVLDPFMGSGTTAQVARWLGRQYLGCELNPEYEALQKQRIPQPREPEPTTPADPRQMNLLDAA